MKKQMIVITIGSRAYSNVFTVDNASQSTISWAIDNALQMLGTQVHNYPRSFEDCWAWTLKAALIKQTLGVVLYDYLSSLVRRYGQTIKVHRLSVRKGHYDLSGRPLCFEIGRVTPANRRLI